jgi:hypothetical protein
MWLTRQSSDIRDICQEIPADFSYTDWSGSSDYMRTRSIPNPLTWYNDEADGSIILRYRTPLKNLTFSHEFLSSSDIVDSISSPTVKWINWPYSAW